MILKFNSDIGGVIPVNEIFSSSVSSLVSENHKNNVFFAKFSSIYFVSLLTLGLGSISAAHAVIVADGTQAGAHPSINSAVNGSTIVNINSANAGGISHNIYTQFDVDKAGVVLNNSMKGANTQLAGQVGANTNLFAGEAKIILNEVNSSNPSSLNGMIEVAGKQAQVIIANASGITCSGCGFINADRTTLTTGKAQLVNGRLEGYKVEQGNIVVYGDGLKNNGTNYTNLIARSVQVNAGIWAKDLKVTTGRNRVNTDNTEAQALPTIPGNSLSSVGIDVSSLGGMYAGKIKLVGTEQGVGVRNAGAINASGSDLVIDVNGQLDNMNGQITSTETIAINTHYHTLNNNQTLTNNSREKGAGISGERGVFLMTGGLNNQQGSIVSKGHLDIQTVGSLDNRNGKIVTTGSPVSNLTTYIMGALDNRNGEIISKNSSMLFTQGTMDNTQGKILSGGVVQIVTNGSALHNNSGVIESGDGLNIDSGEVNNNFGRLKSSSFLVMNTNGKALINRGRHAGTGIFSGTYTLLDTYRLNNDDGQILSDGDIFVHNINGISNSGGIIKGKGMTEIIDYNWGWNYPW